MTKCTAILTAVCLFAACSTPRIVDVPSANQSSRINHLVLHFTSENFTESMRLLTQQTDNRVSAHYLVPEPGDDTYPGRTLQVYRLVPEARRAWHAGRSSWAGTNALNDSSVGIEIVNRSRCTFDNPDVETQTPESRHCTFLVYPDEQIALVIQLAKAVLARNPDIDPVDVVGHGDIAPDRRVDPGPAFPWQRLYENGIGAWYDDATVEKYRRLQASEPPELREIQRALATYGYAVEETGENDVQTRFAVSAFQMHFRPEISSGQIDAETTAILFALIEKYRPGTSTNYPDRKIRRKAGASGLPGSGEIHL